MLLHNQYDGQNKAPDCPSRVLPDDREAHTCIVDRGTNGIVLSRNNLAVPQEVYINTEPHQGSYAPLRNENKCHVILKHQHQTSILMKTIAAGCDS